MPNNKKLAESFEAKASDSDQHLATLKSMLTRDG